MLFETQKDSDITIIWMDKSTQNHPKNVEGFIRLNTSRIIFRICKNYTSLPSGTCLILFSGMMSMRNYRILHPFEL